MDLLAPRVDKRVGALLWLLYVWVMLRNAWLCEDSFITYRVVDNWADGYGPRWNVLDRVQVYTHPLWMLAVSAVHFVARDVYFSAMAVSLVCSGVAVWLLLTRAMKSTAQCLVAAVVLTFSKAFMDYSTGGLENPLAHLLLVLFFLEYLKPEDERSERRFRRMLRWAALVLVTRMDLLWLLLPALVHVTWRGGYWRRRHLRVWLAMWPFVAWEVFALLYYGFLFPNSAYAKLGLQVPLRGLVAQGLCYLLNSLSWDPLTLFATTALTAVGFRLGRRDRRALVLSCGVVLYLVYVVRVGGDYMSGRFLTAPLLVSLFVLARVEIRNAVELTIALGVALVLGVTSPRPPILTRDDYVGLGSSPQFVDDEHGYRHGDTALIRRSRMTEVASDSGWAADGKKARREHQRVVVYPNIGYYGFFAGPTVHVVDPYGVGDPLLARIPVINNPDNWAAGHWERHVPEGYPDAAVGKGRIKDPEMAEYWRKLQIVTRGPIFDRARLLLVLRFNLGLEPSP
jgi:arabinofuranosyltransferase